MQNKSTLFKVVSIVFYVIAALLFIMRTEENGYMTFAVISLVVGAVFSSVSAAITLNNKDRGETDEKSAGNADGQTDERADDYSAKK